MNKEKEYGFSVSYSDDQNKTKGVTVLCNEDNIGKAISKFSSIYNVKQDKILGIVRNI